MRFEERRCLANHGAIFQLAMSWIDIRCGVMFDRPVILAPHTPLAMIMPINRSLTHTDMIIIPKENSMGANERIIRIQFNTDVSTSAL